MRVWALYFTITLLWADTTLFSASFSEPPVHDEILDAAATTRNRTAALTQEVNGLVDEISQMQQEQAERLEPVGYTCQGRLTLEADVPVSTTNQTSGTLRFTPFVGNRIALYDGTKWVNYTFTDGGTALTLSVTSGNNYDVFAYYTGAAVNLELSAAWTSDVSRTPATDLVRQDGVWVKSGTTTRRFLGTIRASAANTVADTEQKRFVWNFYNRRPRLLRRVETTNSWSYNTSTAFRSVNNDGTNNKAEWVVGINESLISMRGLLGVNTSAGTVRTLVSQSFGLDTTSTQVSGLRGTSVKNSLIQQMWSEVQEFGGLGYHTFNWLEIGKTDEVWYGDNGDASGRLSSGFYGWVEG